MSNWTNIGSDWSGELIRNSWLASNVGNGSQRVSYRQRLSGTKTNVRSGEIYKPGSSREWSFTNTRFATDRTH